MIFKMCNITIVIIYSTRFSRSMSIIFIIFDVVTPNTLKISDNFLYPFISVIVLAIFIYAVGFQIDAVVANFLAEINQWYVENAPELV